MNSKLLIIAMFLLIFFIFVNDNKYNEDFANNENSDAEAIKNLASIYNKQDMKLSNLEITNKLKTNDLETIDNFKTKKATIENKGGEAILHLNAKGGNWQVWADDSSNLAGFYSKDKKARMFTVDKDGNAIIKEKLTTKNLNVSGRLSGLKHNDHKEVKVHDGYWGGWTGWKMCPNGQYVCGAKARVEGSQGGGDDTAMNGIRLRCCSF